MTKRRSFSRPKPVRRYRKLYLIATEGRKTEMLYFAMFNSQEATIHIQILPSKYKTSPPQVLNRAKKYVKQEQLKKNDEIWIVIDRDSWEREQLEEVFEGCQKFKYNLAVSNPLFEYWLLLHFENGKGIKSSKECSLRLQKFLPHFEKGRLEITKIIPRIQNAIQHAEAKDKPPCQKWPDSNGSTVYRLVKKLPMNMSCLPKD